MADTSKRSGRTIPRTRSVGSGEFAGSKIPPHSDEAEMAVLGALLLDRAAVSKSIEILEPECFHREAHRLIYMAVLSMFERGLSIDILSLAEELRKQGTLENVGGTYYLTEVNASVATGANVESHARIVLERYLKRSLILTAGEIIDACYDETTDALEEIDSAEAKIFNLAEKRLKRGYVGMASLARDTFSFITKMMEGGGEHGITGVPSGIVKLDELLGGFQPSDLVILAARPSMGKTALALSMARNIAMEYGKAVGFFSIEMDARQIMLRLLSAEAKINMHDLRTNRIKPEQVSLVVEALGRMAEAPIYIDDSASITMMELRAKCRRLKAEHDVRVVFVDYLQLISPPKAESREREISMISRSLKQTAKELNITIVSLAQLNRSVESRSDKRPMLSDLRESGSIEQDADVVMFVNRPEVYGITQYDDGATTEGTAELIVGKQRNGPIGDVRVAYVKSYARFENLSLSYDISQSYVSGNENTSVF